MKSIYTYIIFKFKILTCVVLLFVLTSNIQSQIDNQKCLLCHSKTNFNIKEENGTIKQLFVNDSLLQRSPHEGFYCTDCHIDITEITVQGHKKDVKEVQCIRCHYDNNNMGAPETKKYKEYKESVHSKEWLKGNKNTPIGQTCHSSHDIKSRSSISTLELKKKISQVCGECHYEIYTVYRSSIHGVALYEKNISDVPICTDCHGEHSIKKSDDTDSSVNKANIHNTCGNCHTNEKIVGKYGITADKLKTYESSFHGISGLFGENTVANCASCHGAHDIKPQSDPTSSINPNNLVRTCGKCHQDANVNYVKGRIHIDTGTQEAGFNFYFGFILKWLNIITIILFAMHVILDQYGRIKHKENT